MKTLLTILFTICIGCVAQGQRGYKQLYQEADSVYEEALKEKLSNQVLYFYKTLPINKRKDVTIKKRLITLDDLINYQQDCYNDSTHITNEVQEFNGASGKLEWRVINEYYVPHVTPTFEGFIEWLKK